MERVELADLLSECFENWEPELKMVMIEEFSLLGDIIPYGFHQCIWLALRKTMENSHIP